MSWPAYSERFLHHSGNGWWIYWVPEKRRAIITHISVANASTAVVGVTAYIGPIAYYYLGSLAAYSAVQVPLRQVAYQREDIAIFIAGGAHVTVSGYLLEDNTGRTGPPPSVAPLPSPTTRPPPPGFEDGAPGA
jgi:hypothetical protein